MKTFSLKTTAQHSWIDITNEINGLVAIETGICVVFNPHSTAALFVNSCRDPKTPQDIYDTIQQLVPLKTNYHHQFDTPSDAAGHIKSVLFGNSYTIPVENRKLKLGGSQSVVFAEFDGPREREIWLTFIEC